MISVFSEAGVFDEEPILPSLANLVAECLGEDNVYVKRGDYNSYRFEFEDNTSFFEVSRIIDADILSFTLKLCVRRQATNFGRSEMTEYGIWSEEFSNIDLELLRDKLNIYSAMGFPDGGNGFNWESTQRKRQKIEMDMGYRNPFDDDDSVPDEPDGSSLFGDLPQNPFKDDSVPSEPAAVSGMFGDLPHFAAVSPFGEGSDEEDETEQSAPDVATLTNQPRIVPDFIGRIRVVALKYQGQVIAFRFKTDAGAFDMRKSVAVGYGLGEFKTEKFITLENVNGLLMSNSEREQRVCVPDVSDCPEDCERLMQALFNK